MAANPESKMNMNETNQLGMNQQQVGYPSYGSHPPHVVQTNVEPPAYIQPVNVQYGNSSVDQTCCISPQQTSVEMETNGDKVDDFFKVKPPLTIDFKAVFQEPTGGDGVNFVTTYNSAIYFWTKRCLYIFLSCLLGPIMAFFFGFIFGVMNFVVIWLFNPMVHLIHIFSRFISDTYRPLARVILDPVFESFGQMYRIRNSGEFTEQKYKLDVSGITIGGNSNEPNHQHTA